MCFESPALVMLQVSKYDFSRPGWKSGSGLLTQMVWRSSKGVGCAVNTACTWATYVCHYSPPGAMPATSTSEPAGPVCLLQQKAAATKS